MFNFRNKEYEEVSPFFSSNVVPIFMSVSNEFVPYFSTLLASIADCSSNEKNYDIIIFHKGDITPENQSKLREIVSPFENLSLRFYDVGLIVKGWQPYLRGHVTILTYFRFVAPYILSGYDKAIYMDGDTIVMSDIGELFEIELEDNYLGAVKDAAAAGIYTDGRNKTVVDSFDNILKLKHPENYFQAGVLLVNLKKFREEFSLEQLMKICEGGPWYFVDQDVLNFLCQSKVRFIDMAWNVESYASLEIPLKFAPDEVKFAYENARKDPKVIHFAGATKPWNIPSSDFGRYFWKYASKSPFYLELLENLSKQENRQIAKKAEKKTVIIRCVTVFHLFNAINIKLNLHPNDKTYVILSGDTDWGDIPERLASTQVFSEVVVSGMTKVYPALGKMGGEKRFEATLNPRSTIIDAGGIKEIELIDSISEEITDYYVALEYSMERFLFYYMQNRKNANVRVHHYEEGTASYVLDYYTRIINDGLGHNRHGEDSYLKHVTDLLLYEPSLFVGKKGNWPIRKLEGISVYDIQKRDIMYSVFGKPFIPKERYIFFESPIVAENQISADIDLVDVIAEIVGKENLVIKLHPRNRRNRFEIRGYKTIGSEMPLWEVANFLEGYSNKVFLSEISTTTLTSKSIFGHQNYSINLFKLLKLCNSFFVEQRAFPQFYEKFSLYMNVDNRRNFSPRTLGELKEILQYVKGKDENAYE